jgi:tetratricopeptide (TPR) repeat protein
MTLWRRHVLLILALLLCATAGYGWHIRPQGSTTLPPDIFDRVVVPAPLQIILTGGDRYLAADLEAIRALATQNDAPEAMADNLSFAIRARNAVAHLNGCHEDNYYLANALLTWGGAASHGNEVLRLATDCRFWDEFPPFFYGFNLYYFERNFTKATQALNEAANRSPTNANALRKLAIMLMAESFEDDAVALAYLESERDQARDMKLRETLNKRVIRLQGLIGLRQAQEIYEQRYGHPLENPHALITANIIANFPEDPMQIGYEFHEGRFRMREIKIPGQELPKK